MIELTMIWLGFVTLAITLGTSVDNGLKSDAKCAFGNWLLRLPNPEGLRAWKLTLLKAFDQVFGSEPISLNSFIRSTVASVGVLALLVAAWFAILAEPTTISRWRLYFNIIVPLLCVSAVVTAGPGYLVFLETRLAVHLIATRGRLIRLLVLDFVATFLLGWLVIAPFYAIMKTDLSKFSKDVLQMSGSSSTFQIFQDQGGQTAISLFGEPSGTNVNIVNSADSDNFLVSIPLGIWYYSVFSSSL